MMGKRSRSKTDYYITKAIGSPKKWRIIKLHPQFVISTSNTSALAQKLTGLRRKWRAESHKNLQKIFVIVTEKKFGSHRRKQHGGVRAVIEHTIVFAVFYTCIVGPQYITLTVNGPLQVYIAALQGRRPT